MPICYPKPFLLVTELKHPGFTQNAYITPFCTQKYYTCSGQDLYWWKRWIMLHNHNAIWNTDKCCDSAYVASKTMYLCKGIMTWKMNIFTSGNVFVRHTFFLLNLYPSYRMKFIIFQSWKEFEKETMGVMSNFGKRWHFRYVFALYQCLIGI